MRRLACGLLIGLVVFWLAARTLPCLPLVFPAPGQVRLFEVDSYFHVRQARALIKNFPHLQRWDPSSDYPHGQRGPNQGGYDLLLALLAMAAGLGHPDQPTLLSTAALAPLLLGTLGFLALGLTARRLLGAWKGLVAPFFLAVYPGTLATYAVLGFADHHALEVCLAYTACLALVLALQKPDRKRAVWLALPLVGLLYSWAGAALYLFLLALCLAGAALAGARGVTRLTLTVSGLLAVLWLLPSLVWPDLRMGEPYFQAAGVALAGLAVSVTWLAEGLRRRNKLLLLALAATVLGALFVPWVRGALTTLLEPRSTSILEHRDVTASLFTSYFGPFGWLAPVGLLLALRSREPARVGAALYAFLLLALWVRTRDFTYLAPPAVALLVALAVAPLLRRPLLSALTPLVLAVPALASMTTPAWPSTQVLGQILLVTPGWSQAAEWLSTHSPVPSLDLDSPLQPWGDDLRYPPGTYGVYTPWDRGHLVSFLARRPVVFSATESRQGAAWLALDQEQQAVDQLSQGCQPGEEVRYVMLGAEVVAESFLTELQVAGISQDGIMENAEQVVVGSTRFDLPVFGRLYRRSMACRLFLGDAEGMEHFRLVYESPSLSFVTYTARFDPATNKLEMLRRSLPVDGPEGERLRAISGAPGVFPVRDSFFYHGQVASEVKIFQVVRGAQVTTPGPAEATLVLTCGTTGRTWSYLQKARRGADGLWHLSLPYPTTAPAGDVKARGPYLIDGRPLHVTEAQVQGGQELRAP